MNLKYVAAEYYVEAIALNPIPRVSFKYIRYLANLIGQVVGQETADYLQRHSNDDFLYIFKKFPDIFKIKNGSVRLTEPFMSLYCLTKSAVNSKQCHGTNSYVENCAIAYFNKILIRGPQQYLTLFSLLVNDSTQKFSRYFSRFTVIDALNFFLFHSNYFVVVNGIVFLNQKPSFEPNPPINNQFDVEAMKILKASAYFLLTCFKPLHYLELKQCLSYVQLSTKGLLEQISLVKQRELFENLPLITMDSCGFLYLKIKKVFTDLSNTDKTILLMVLILSFKRDLHIVNLTFELSITMPSYENYFSSLSLPEQIEFIKQYPAYFCVSNGLHVSLLPSFFVPSRSFLESSKKHRNPLIAEENVKITERSRRLNDSKALKNIGLPNSVATSFHEDVKEKLQNADSLTTTENVSSSSVSFKNNDGKPSETLSYTKNIALESNSQLHQEDDESSFIDISFKIPKNMCKLLSHCAELLRNYSKLSKNVDILKAAVFSFTDICIYFYTLPNSDQYQLVESCLNFLSEKSQNYSTTISKEEEEIFLITYLVCDKKIHFQTIAKELTTYHCTRLFSLNFSLQFNYFEEAVDYFVIDSDGFVTLTSPFKHINTVIDCVNRMMSKTERSQIAESKGTNNNNEASYETHKIASDDIDSHNKEICNSSLDVQTSCCENILETLAPCSDSNTSITSLNVNKTQNVVLINKGACSDVDKKGKEKNSESKNHSLRDSETTKLKMFNQSFNKSFTFNSHKSIENRLSDTVDSSTNGFSKVPMSNEGDAAVNETYNVKSNSTHTPACDDVSLSGFEDEPLKKSSEVLETPSVCSPMSDSFQDDLVNDSSYSAYISDLIDELMHSDSTASSNPKASRSYDDFDDAHSKEREVKSPISETSKSDQQFAHDRSEVADTDMDSKSLNWKNGPVESLTNTNKDRNSELNYVSGTSKNEPALMFSEFPDSTCKTRNESQNLPTYSKVLETVPRQQSLIRDEQHCDKVADVPDAVISSTLTVSEEVIEERAVNFFSIVLRSYKHYNESISIDFLKKHINSASAEVQSFMFEHYKHNVISFFQKHTNVFYVSPITRCVYLL